MHKGEAETMQWVEGSVMTWSGRAPHAPWSAKSSCLCQKRDARESELEKNRKGKFHALS
jgi:hypothetical protein